MKLTQLNMTLETSDSPIIKMVGEFVLDHELVIKNVCLCQNKYGNYYLKFPESQGSRVSHPIKKDFYAYLLSATLAEYDKKRSILGRKTDEKKDWEII